MIQHVNPPQTRRSQAPYNFVPLPNAVFWAPPCAIEAAQHFDEFLAGKHSGYIDLEIMTETPLFIRGPIKQLNDVWDSRETRLRPDPYLDLEDHPVIPGSSLRGAIRSLFEILTFSRIQPVTKEKPFYRSLSPDRVGAAYRSRMVQRGTLAQIPRAGFIQRSSDGSFVILEASSVLRVSHDRIRKVIPAFNYGHDASYHPEPAIQHQTVWIKGDFAGREAITVELDPAQGLSEAMLVLTGWAPARPVRGEERKIEKSKEFAFLKAPKGAPIQISDSAWRRFHDEDQITQYQEKAFPPDGHLSVGDPVFFVCDPDGRLDFFGRAGMFRLPYDESPFDLLPPEHRTADSDHLDLTETVFGFVPQNSDDARRTVRGRVEFEDAVAIRKVQPLDAFVPKILSSPKVTCYQHYLTQDGDRDKRSLTTYLQGDTTTIRGHKLYWHRWNGLVSAMQSNQIEILKKPGTQDTIIRPIPENTTFNGRIHFHNLLDFELGALWAALALPEGHAHKIGMAKSLGLGSIRIKPTLHILEPETRYGSWKASGYIRCDNPGECYMSAFEERIARHANETREPIAKAGAGLARVYRLNVLYQMLMHSERQSFSKMEPLPLRDPNGGGDFSTLKREGWILPTPHSVMGHQDAEPACLAVDRPAPALSVSTVGGVQVESTPHANIERDRQANKAPKRAPISVKSSQPQNPEGVVRKPETCTVLHEKNKQGGLVMGIDRFPGSKGRINPRSLPKLPADLAPGMKLEMLVTRNGDGSYTLSLP